MTIAGGTTFIMSTAGDFAGDFHRCAALSPLLLLN
jgi:hypothetical protein